MRARDLFCYKVLNLKKQKKSLRKLRAQGVENSGRRYKGLRPSRFALTCSLKWRLRRCATTPALGLRPAASSGLRPPPRASRSPPGTAGLRPNQQRIRAANN